MLLQDFYMFWNNFLPLIRAAASLSFYECPNRYVIHRTEDTWTRITVNDLLRTDTLPRILNNKLFPMPRMLECLKFVHDLLNY